MTPQTSTSFSLNKADLEHIGRHFLFSALGAGMAYLIGDVIPYIHLSGFGTLCVPVITAILVSFQSFLKDNTGN